MIITSLNNPTIKEISKLGYNKIYTNKKQIDSLKEEVDADLIGVSTIDEVIGRLVFRK